MPKKNDKKILFITYYWPPYAGGGVQRALKWVKYLSRLGWGITVITSNKNYLETMDRSLTKEVPKTVKIIKTANFSPNTVGLLKRIWNKQKLSSTNSTGAKQNDFKKLLLDAASMLRILQLPDESFGWAPFILRQLYRHKGGVDVIVVSAPPFSALFPAVLMKKALGVPLVVDVRDAWANLPANQHAFNYPEWRRKIDLYLEKIIIPHADFITVVSGPMKKYFERLGVLKTKIEVIENGFDTADFMGLKRKKKPDGEITIIYTGVFYGEVVPKVFLEGVKLFVKKYPGLISKLKFLCIGRKNLEIETMARGMGVKIAVEHRGFLPHKKALELLINADIALSMINSGRGWDAVFNGRTFEYLNSGVPILALTPTRSAVTKLLEKTGAGISITNNDPREVSRALEKIIFHKEKLPLRNVIEIKKYSRGMQVKTLDKILRKLVGN